MAPAAVRTRPAWRAWTCVHALAFHPDDRRRRRCLHRDRGYLRRDGYLVRQRRHLGRHRRPDVSPGLRQHPLDAERSRLDDRQEPDGQRRQEHRDAHLEHRDVRQGHRERARLGAAHAEHQDAAPGRGCFRQCAARLDAAPGRGCYRLDADAAVACLKANPRARHSSRCLLRQARQARKAPEVRSAPLVPPGWSRGRSWRLHPMANQRARRRVPKARWPRRVPLQRVQRPAWALGDEVHQASVRSLPWVSRVPERVPWRRGRPHGPCARRGLPVSRTVP